MRRSQNSTCGGRAHRHFSPLLVLFGLAMVTLTILIASTSEARAICTSACNHETCTDCGSGWECKSDCTSFSCTGFTYCSCIGSCNLSTKHVEEKCECKTRPVGGPGGQAQSWVIATTSSVWWSFSPPSQSPLTLSEFGVAIEDLSGWGVVLAGNLNHTISAGDFSGTFQSIVNGIGTASGFAVSWNNASHVVTFTGN